MKRASAHDEVESEPHEKRQRSWDPDWEWQCKEAEDASVEATYLHDQPEVQEKVAEEACMQAERGSGAKPKHNGAKSKTMCRPFRAMQTVLTQCEPSSSSSTSVLDHMKQPRDSLDGMSIEECCTLLREMLMAPD